jgi:hypothetical protein
MLPRAALMPPWAATVCERVGKSFDMQAVLRPDSVRPTAARRPAPPEPMTMALVVLVGGGMRGKGSVLVVVVDYCQVFYVLTVYGGESSAVFGIQEDGGASSAELMASECLRE